MDDHRADGRQRSAFAAAVFSLLFPGLGHAYLGRWSRAIAWATPPILVIALVAGLMAAPGTRERVLEWVLTDEALTGILVFLGIDLLYRMLCVLDAWRLARSGHTGSTSATALVSFVGLLAVVMVLGASHLAVARPVMVAMGTLNAIEDDPGDAGDASFDPALVASFRPVTPPPTPTPDPSGSPAPVEPTASPAPTPTQGPSWDEGGRLSILLIGADSGRANYGGYLTDTMIVATVDTRTKQSAFISIPRDMQGIPIPRDWPAYGAYGGIYSSPINTLYTAARINPSLWAPGADKAKGFAALKGVLGELYGLHIDYYVAVDLHGFRSVIDTLGGVVVDVQNPVYDYHYPADDGRLGHLKLYVPPGLQYMNGTQSLAFARARKLTSDFDRADRQQRVVTSLRQQVDLSSLLAPGVIDGLLRAVRSDIRTDIPASKLPKLAQLAQTIDIDQRISLVLTPPTFGTECYLQPSCPRDYRLVADVPRIRSAVGNIFKADREEARQRQKLLDEGAVVHVLNGTRLSNLKTTKVADSLASLGLDATVPPVDAGAADRDDYGKAVIIAWNGAQSDVPLAGQVLSQTMGVKVIARDDPNVDADYTVIVGSSTAPPR